MQNTGQQLEKGLCLLNTSWINEKPVTIWLTVLGLSVSQRFQFWPN